MTSTRRARSELFRRTVSAVTLVAFVVSQTGALAGPIADPAAPIGFRPSVSTTPSGASVVNIVAPSAAGTSHNKYSTFEVGAKGVVLNNSLGAGASVLAGALGANPNLSGAFATVILNEVTGSGASGLGGPLEVFGHAASVIVANPNGITCAGCSFINAPRILLTTGAPFYTGSTLGFEVTGGAIGVSGTGLDGSGLTRLDLIGGTLAIDAPVTGAQQLNLLAGRLKVDYVTGAVTPTFGASGSGYAIDASALGSLQAGQIRLQATDAGVGVRALGGVAATADDLVLAASGEIQVAGATATRDFVVTAGAFAASATNSVGRDFTATVTSFTNEGSVSAGRAVQIDATGSVTNSGNLESGGAADVTAGGAFTNRGSLAAQNDLNVSGTSVANITGAVLSRSGVLAVTTPGAIDNTAGSLSGAEVTLSGASLDNSGGFVFSEGKASVAVSGPLTNAAGQVLTGGDLAISAGALDNRGGIALGRDVTLAVASLDNSANGRVAADRDLAITAAGSVHNAGGTLSANRDTRLTTQSLANESGSVTAVGNLALAATSSLTGAGLIGANGTVTLTGGTLAPGGDLVAGGDLRVDAQAFNTAAAARVFGDATIRGGSVTNSGSLGSRGAIDIDVTGAVTNSGVLAANTDLTIAAATIANQPNASMLALGNQTLRAGAVTNTGGTIQAGHDLTIDAQTLANQRGPVTTVYSATDARGSAGGLFGSRPTGDLWQSWSQTETTGPAQLLAGNNLVLSVGTGLNDASLYAAGNNVSISGDAFTNQSHQLLITTYHTWYRWKSKLLGRKEAVTDVYYSWSGTPSTLQAGSELKIALTGTLNNSGNLIAHSVNAAAQNINTGIFDYYAQTPPTVEPKSAIDLSQYGSLPTGPNQLFTENRDPASRFLIGIDPSLPLSNLVLLSPEYFAQRLGQAEGANRFYADPFAEAALLRAAALAQTGRAYFVADAATDEAQRLALYEAALRFADTHPGLVLGEAFTPELIAQLDAPVLWYVRNQDGILVPTVYLPQLARENLANVQGGLLQANDIQLAAIATIDNTGFIAGQRVSLQASELINQKRSADVGRIVRHEKDYWYEITGDTVQPGGFITAAALEINAERLTSISGEFYQAGEEVSGQLRGELGERATFSENRDNLDTQTHQYKKDPTEQIVIAAVAIALSIITYGAASALIGSMAGAGAGSGSFFAAAGTAAGSAGAGLGNVVLASAISGMAANTATQLMATGSVDVGNVLKAGLTSGLTAGLTRGIGDAIGNQTLGASREIAGSTGDLVKSGAATTDLGDKIVGYTIRAAITSGTNQAIYGNDAGSFGTAFLNSWVASAAADSAKFVGESTQPLSLENIAAHALVGCAAAAASGGDCGAGALGAAAAATVNPILDKYDFVSQEDGAVRSAQVAAIATVVSGTAANATGQDIATSIQGAQNETLNNYLAQAQRIRFAREFGDCPNSVCKVLVGAKYGLIDKGQDAAYTAGFVAGVPGELAIGVYDLVKTLKDPTSFIAAMKVFLESDNKLGLIKDGVVTDFKERLATYEKAYESGGIGAAEAGFEAGRLFTLVVTSVAGIPALARASVTVPTTLVRGLGKVAAAVAEDMVRSGPRAQRGGSIGNVAARSEGKTDVSLAPDRAPMAPLVTGRIDIANMEGSMSFRGPDIGTLVRNDGQLGEFLGGQVLKSVSEIDFRSIQNPSGHGIDLVGVDSTNQTIVHLQVKTSTLTGQARIPGEMPTDYQRWVTDAAGGTLNGQRLDSATTQFAQTLEDLRVVQHYRVEHRVLDVSIPPQGQAGSTTMTLSPWPRPPGIMSPNRP